MISETGQFLGRRMQEPRPVDSTVVKQAIRENIRKLDYFPKMEMIVDDKGTVEDKWGVEIAWTRSNPELTHPDTGFILTWNGLYEEEVARCDYNHSSKLSIHWILER
ncbi:MAG: hypothetical protein COX79_02295 [Candidatus Levybacteria bacterium CG_4_10_14_0_2_um_filter_36_16]|nr:MAG: hypothetical protein AUK12_02740 [Candidatus Levybacteria bacterium CG2_30_37_29]PIZ97407.1 MAG: hypothetical protein COX79_02295 [Candidatus Levybacteria bacterium CG_4_10_14_0_2_um_filter_36_16]